jgi:hypothetical protein
MLNPMGTRNRPTPTADRLTVARLQGAAKRHGGWTSPSEEKREEAIAELRAIGGDQRDAYAEAAGIMLGCHPADDASHDRYRVAAELLLEAGGLTVDDPDVQQWIAVGEWRRTRTRAAMAAGDTFDRAFRSSSP